MGVETGAADILEKAIKSAATVNRPVETFGRERSPALKKAMPSLNPGGDLNSNGRDLPFLGTLFLFSGVRGDILTILIECARSAAWRWRAKPIETSW